MEKLYGLIGEKLGHTFSPAIHREIMKKINIEGHYGVFPVKRENLKNVVLGLKALSYNGINVTIPYKTDIMECLDSVSKEAVQIGAVNVVHIGDDGTAKGYNTDYYGFGMMLENNNINVAGEVAVILGTGGASKAVLQYLKDGKAKDVILVTRDVSSSKDKYPNEKIITYDDLESLRNASVIINSTPVGMFPNTGKSPIGKNCLGNFSTAVDLIYNPIKTLFLQEAEEKGLKAVNGLYMLVAQAVKSQEIWNNIEIPKEVITEIIDSGLII